MFIVENWPAFHLAIAAAYYVGALVMEFLPQ